MRIDFVSNRAKKANFQLRDSSVLPPKMDTETAIEDLYDTMEYEEEDTYDSMGDWYERHHHGRLIWHYGTNASTNNLLSKEESIRDSLWDGAKFFGSFIMPDSVFHDTCDSCDYYKVSSLMFM